MICVRCCKVYRPKKNGVYFEEMMPGANGHEANAEGWSPYKLWVGDLLECPGCHHQVIAGIPQQPQAEHYQEDYAQWRERFNPMLQVNDCGSLQLGALRLAGVVAREQELSKAFDKIAEVRDELQRLSSELEYLGTLYADSEP